MKHQMTHDELNQVRQSLGRCLLSGDFIGEFYDRFLNVHPDAATMFENTDFVKQKRLLRTSISWVIMFSDVEDSIAKSGLKRIRQTHSKHNLNIPPHFYGYWKTSLLETIKHCDAKVNAAVMKSWAKSFDNAIEYIASGYELSDQEHTHQKAVSV